MPPETPAQTKSKNLGGRPPITPIREKKLYALGFAKGEADANNGKPFHENPWIRGIQFGYPFYRVECHIHDETIMRRLGQSRDLVA